MMTRRLATIRAVIGWAVLAVGPVAWGSGAPAGRAEHGDNTARSIQPGRAEVPQPARPRESAAPRPRSVGRLLDLAEGHAQRAVVTRGTAPPNGSEPTAPMLAQLAGTIADLRGPELVALRNCEPRNPLIGDPTGAERLCTVHLSGGGGSQRMEKRVDILRTPAGEFIAVEVETGPDGSARAGRRGVLDRGAFAAMLAGWPAYRGGFAAPTGNDADPPRLRVFELTQPLTPSPFVMDKATLGRRFYGVKSPSVPASARDLSREHLWAFVPERYSPKHPAGLMVWINAAPEGRPPTAMHRAAAEAGIILISAQDVGNDRLVSERFQLALDAAATARARFHIDPRRIYVSGISGGGRVASMLVACYPEVFTGAVPIVGLNCYRVVPNGVGRFYPAGYARPPEDVFRVFTTRPVAAITGPADENYISITNGADLLRRDGLLVRVFDVPGMGHEMPPPASVAEAIAWVDEPYQRAIARDREEAAKAMKAYIARNGDGPPKDDKTRKLLVRVAEVGPWTDRAWQAAEWLGVAGGGVGEGAEDRGAK